MWVLGVLGCAPAPATGLELPYTFEPRTAHGEVRVVRAFGPSDVDPRVDLALELGSWLGPPSTEAVLAARTSRLREIAHLGEAVGDALPGEVNAVLGDRWPGQFRTVDVPGVARARLALALTGPTPELDLLLSEAAQRVGGDATLFTWVDAIDVTPVTMLDAPGSVVVTEAGPVVVDGGDEPYVLAARVTLALVASDGEVLLRYGDTYHAVLTGNAGPAEAGRTLAHELATEVAKVWGIEADRRSGEPDARHRRWTRDR